MAGFRSKKICELRGEEVSWDGNNVQPTTLQPAVIELYKYAHLLDSYYIKVTKTTGAPESAEFHCLAGGSITATHDSLICSGVIEVIDCDPDTLDFFLAPGTTTEVHLKGAEPNELLLFIVNLPPFIKDKIRRVHCEEDLQTTLNLQRQLWEMGQQLHEKEWQQKNLQRQLREMQKQLAHCQGNLRKNEKQETKLRGQLMEKEQQLTRLLCDKEKESAHLQQKLSVKLKELDDVQRELRDREQDNVNLQKDLSAAKEIVSKYQSQLRTRDWVLNRDEIQLTDNCLGAGGWGRVVKGRYCGCAVAIKQLHQPTLSPKERDLFEREMDIASRCRHPCLLQFIGASVDESPLFVTELMETSLRALLGKQQLSQTEVSVISLDVARALNYLHQRKPKPIVHRDVSSANVLLWKQNNQWRGKVSDYGTAKFLEEIMTCAVGALIYSAPETDCRHNQTVKMDVYSFGVLLCEMFIRDLPDRDRRDEQVARVRNREFRGLILWCIEEDPMMRPSMEEIIEKLEQFNGMS